MTMKMRRSRGTILIATVLLIHIIAFSLFKFGDNTHTLDRFKESILDLKKALLENSYTKKPSDGFDQKVDSILQTIIRNQDEETEKLLYSSDLKNRKDFNEIILPDYLIDTTKKQPQVQHFDPRFTVGLITNYLTRKISSGEIKDKDELVLPYFHWSDFVDLSELNQYFHSKDKADCKFFSFVPPTRSKLARLEVLPIESYCLNEDTIDDLLTTSTDSTLVDNLKVIKEQQYSSGFHIYTAPGRSTFKLRPILAKSYLHDFMLAPYSILMLLPEQKSINIQIDRDITKAKKNLLKSGIATSYIEMFKVENGGDGPVTLNIQKELSAFIDATNKHPNLLQPVNTLKYEKALDHAQFIDESKAILREMKREDVSKFTLHQKSYFEALEYSIGCRDPPKYFHEAKIFQSERNFAIGAHYDWRFFNGVVNNKPKHQPALHQLIQAWFRFTNSQDITTWIAHGTLLSWYWDGMSFPWDNDSDVQMPIDQLHKLSRNFNQTLIIDIGNDPVTQEIRYGRYFIDCGSFLSSRERGNSNNFIDARFIDVDTGLYVDITGLAVSRTPSPGRYDGFLTRELARTPGNSDVSEFMRNDFLQVYNCRNNHFSRLADLSPLKLSMHEGEYAYLPNQVELALSTEYGEKSIKLQSFNIYTFIPRIRNWIPVKKLKASLQNKEVRQKGTGVSVLEFAEEECLKILSENSDLLMEYLVTREVTERHELELISMRDGNDPKHFFTSSGKLKQGNPLRHDSFSLSAFHDKYKFEESIDQTVNFISSLEMQTPPEKVEPAEQTQTKKISTRKDLPKLVE
ncbi:hypothetical protein G9P44_003191 [Scheffersomyces stipitis]|nr:hypothetical protein G9P44_003191 [Scheffersomyces stipitis]